MFAQQARGQQLKDHLPVGADFFLCPKIDLCGDDADGADGAGSGAANFDKSGKGDLFAVPCWGGGSDGIGASLCCAGNSLACTTQRLLSAY